MLAKENFYQSRVYGRHVAQYNENKKETKTSSNRYVPKYIKPNVTLPKLSARRDALEMPLVKG